ncbi:MAG TPA: N-acetyltransferase, partial [Dokdonella sp.]
MQGRRRDEGSEGHRVAVVRTGRLYAREARNAYRRWWNPTMWRWPMDIEVVHHAAERRFEAIVDGAVCVLEYRLRDGVMVIDHTEVPPAVGGRGIA